MGGLERKVNSLRVNDVIVPRLGSGVHARASWGYEFWAIEPDELVLEDALVRRSELSAMPVAYVRLTRGRQGYQSRQDDCEGRSSVLCLDRPVRGNYACAILVGVPRATYGALEQLESDWLTERIMANFSVVNRHFLGEDFDVNGEVGRLQEKRKAEERSFRWSTRAKIVGAALGGLGVSYLLGGSSYSGVGDAAGWLAVASGVGELGARLASHVDSNSTLRRVKNGLKRYDERLRGARSAVELMRLRQEVESTMRTNQYIVLQTKLIRYRSRQEVFEDAALIARMYFGLESPIPYPPDRKSKDWSELLEKYRE